MPVSSSREYRTMETLIPTSPQKRIESDNYVEGYATTFDKPYLVYESSYDGTKYYEIINRHAIDEADISDVIMQYNHGGKVLARLSNKTLGFECDDKGLFIYADLSKSQAAKDLHEEVSNGLITRMSWSFSVKEDAYNRETRTRTIMKIKKLYDVSAVNIPANPDTEILARSYFDGVIEMERQELSARKKQIDLLKLKLKL